jgi:hypothetical protein
LYVVVPAGTANPSTTTFHAPAAGLATVTDSSESPSALCPASTQVPDVQLKTNRSRSAAGSEGPPIVARRDVEPGVTVTGYSWTAWLAIVNTPRRALPNVVPAARPVNGASRLVMVYDLASGTPAGADAMTSGLGDTVAPRMDTVRVYGVNSTSEVRRASTVTSHTPAVGSAVVRLFGEPAHAPAGGL